MKNKLLFLIILFWFIFITGNYSCIQHYSVSFTGILKNKTWRKTLEAVYNEKNEFEKYTFNFETAKDCEKNSYFLLGQDGCYIFNLCNDDRISYNIEIENDSIYYIPYDFDTIHIGFSRYVEYYDMRSFVLRYDTIINGENKIIKESYSAFDLN